MKDDLVPFGKKVKHDNLNDLGLSYEEAAHGVQSAIKYRMEHSLTPATEPKHLRTGIDMSKADQLGLTQLLIDKGIITSDEYCEYMRLAANQELHMHEEQIRTLTGLKGIKFR